MRLPNDESKFSASFKYLEYAHIFTTAEGEEQFARKLVGKKGSDPQLFTLDEIKNLAKRNNNTDIYTSIFQYNSRNFSEASFMSSLYFDLDSKDLELSLRECFVLYHYLREFIPDDAIRIFFSGGKGFHIECEAICLNTGVSEDVSNIFNFIARTLKDELFLQTIDLKVYDIRRVWRLPNSRHKKTGLFKVPCKSLVRDGLSITEIIDWAKEPREEEVPEVEFSPKANAWYREFVYRYEKDKLNEHQTQQDILSRFLEQGSGNVHFFRGDKVFDKYKLFKNCPAVRNLVNRAETEHHLDHYERLFLCSLLTYTEDSIAFLHSILANCSDYSFELSNSHIQDWIKRREYGIGGRPFTCEKAKQVGIPCSGCDGMAPKRKIVLLDTNKYIETNEVSSPSPVRHAFSILKGN